MPRRRHLCHLIERLSSDEGKRQPTPEEWLWAQDQSNGGGVKLDDASAVMAWSRFFQATPLDLAAAVEAVGNKPADVAEFLRKLRTH
ncbi:DUF3606 domain-containing protein [Xylophilus sp. Leaf220]|uniref:DUF3606 domain-containing protein n=1 Tax=Xylophilus sp. Leaf220 TaxID=1735686 RepID=UPI0009ECC3BE